MQIKLIRAEFRKLLCHGRLMGFFLLLLALNLFLSYFMTPATEHRRVAGEIYEAYQADPDGFDTYYEELELLAITAIRDDTPLPHTYSSDPDCDDLKVLNVIRAQNAYYDGFPALMDKQIKLANQRIQDLGRYGYSERTYSVRAQVQTAERYEQLRAQVQFRREIPRGYDAYLSWEWGNLLILLFLTLLIPTVYRQEKSFGFADILRTSRNGRRQTGVAKAISCLLVTVPVVLCFSATALLAIGLRCGYSSLWNAIQAFRDYATVPFPCNVLEYLLLHTSLRLLGFLLYTAVLAMTASVKLPYFVNVAVGAAVVGLPKWFFSHTNGGTVTAYHYLNPTALLESGDLLGYYRTIQWIGKKPHSLPATLCLLAVLLLCLLLCLTVFLYGRRSRGVHLLRSFSVRLPQKLARLSPVRSVQKRMPKQSRVWFEMKKRKPLLTVAVLMLVLLVYFQYRTATIGSMEHYGEALYIRYINRIAPMTDTEREAYLKSENERVDTLIQAYDTNRAAMESGEMSLFEYSEYLQKYQNAQGEQVALTRVEQYLNHLAWQEASTGVRGQILYDKGYELLFNPAPNFFLIAVLLFLCVPTFSVEYDRRGRGCSQIIRATYGGSRRIFLDKLWVYLPMTVLLTGLFRLLDYIVIENAYIFPNGQAPLISVQSFAGWSLPLSISRYMILDFLIRILFVAALSGVLLTVASFLKNGILTFGISALLLVIPAVLIQVCCQDTYHMPLVTVAKLLIAGLAFLLVATVVRRKSKPMHLKNDSILFKILIGN